MTDSGSIVLTCVGYICLGSMFYGFFSWCKNSSIKPNCGSHLLFVITLWPLVVCYYIGKFFGK